MSVNLDTIFNTFHAIDALGEHHIGARPSRLSKDQLPFQAIKMVVGGKEILPTVPDGLAVLGYTYSVKCGMDLYSENNPDFSPRMVTLLVDGRKWVTVVHSDLTTSMGWV